NADVKLLRTQHNIIGLMTGTLPLAPQQNVLLGLPMQLIPEEVTYLLRVRAVVLIDHSAWEREGLTPAGSSSERHIQTALPGSIWVFPETPSEKARCAVFDDLHARGYFLGTGLRFGGEFVVYPGDPLRYHSHFSTSVLTSSNQGGMSGLDFVASGRLGTAVKKAHLICAVDTDLCEEGERVATAAGGQEEGESGDKFEEGGLLEGRTTWGRVRYYSLTWSGFGT
ncbi:unnamed protein product, partial [Tilletia controversa]